MKNTDATSLFNMSDKDLWKLFPVILSGHKDIWSDYYEEEKNILHKIIGQYIVRINHIGSTAVRELIAKPTIDILIEINEHTPVATLIEDMEEVGYIFSPQPDKPPPHLMFMKGYTLKGFDEKVFHVHVRYPGDWDELYFRDYLQTNPIAVKEYGDLKVSLLNRFKHNRDAYTDAKGEFVRKATSEARNIFPGKYVF